MLLQIPLLLLLAVSAALAGVPPEERARQHFERISSVLVPAPAREASLTRPVLAEQSPGQLYKNGLPPVWVARIEDENGARGYLMWENSPSGALLEFTLAGKHAPVASIGGLTEGVPALQQFPVPGTNHKPVASGCVPTAGASLVGYWTTHGFPDWSGGRPPGQVESLKHFAARLRGRLNMSELPDTSGYTDDGMPLSGAYPRELALALERDAGENGVLLQTVHAPFSFRTLRTEIGAGRPVLLSCMVRLPHKPQLSWGHEIIGVGWLELDGAEYAGVKDNFYPTGSPEAVRWIRKEAFESLITVLPAKSVRKKSESEAGAGGETAAGSASGKKETP